MEKSPEWSNLDLSKNISNVLMPAQPNFGYEEELDFSTKRRRVFEFILRGWALFWDAIARYPKKERVWNIVSQIEEAKTKEREWIKKKNESK
jgi:hypothetical protein